MKTTWDYTDLADVYLERPSYSDDAVNFMLEIAKLSSHSNVCDVGAGTAHLTLILAKHGFNVTAIEPNDAMRKNGIERTHRFQNVKWLEAIAEDTKQPDSFFDLVTFGSSFNVTDRTRSLKESHRILKPNGWFACMWNHRDLNDPLQSTIENIIKSYLSNYDYGSRREDQESVINESDLFGNVKKIESPICHNQTLEECITAWKSHNTLYRQAGSKFNKIISDIEKVLKQNSSGFVTIPYTTRVWMAQVKK